MSGHRLDVEGMHCGGCEERVEKALGDLEGVRSAEADHEAGEARIQVEGEADEAAMRSAVEALGYEVVGARPT